MTKHKWHNEIVAWAGGAEIEYYSCGVWLSWHEHVGWFDDYEYRIKPQPVEPQYLYVCKSSEGYTSCSLNSTVNTGWEYIGKIPLIVESNDD